MLRSTSTLRLAKTLNRRSPMLHQREHRDPRKPKRCHPTVTYRGKAVQGGEAIRGLGYMGCAAPKDGPRPLCTLQKANTRSLSRSPSPTSASAWRCFHATWNEPAAVQLTVVPFSPPPLGCATVPHEAARPCYHEVAFKASRPYIIATPPCSFFLSTDEWFKPYLLF